MARPGGSTHSTTIRPSKAAPFALRFVGGRWQVKQGEVWRTASDINIVGMPLVITRATGELYGMGVVSRTGKTFRITA